MPRLVGLGLASKMYRNNKELSHLTNFSNNGNEIAFGTIGDASTSEGIFWESINAACVLEIPVVMSVWDDGYGISVPKKYQTTKESISKALAGFEMEEDSNGLKIFRCKGWNYQELYSTYKEATEFTRVNHKPSLVHVEEITQPQGHSTSGSHERYKSKERLKWAKEFDCIQKFKEWLLSDDNGLGKPITTEDALNQIQKDAKAEVKKISKDAWNEFIDEIDREKKQIITQLDMLSSESNLGTVKQTLWSYFQFTPSICDSSNLNFSIPGPEKRWFSIFPLNMYSLPFLSPHGYEDIFAYLFPT